ncbi:oligosaccharide flippase family protein [Halomonas sp. DP8Y7-1]|uniref:lipid II flippase MurJ n=1 Tax=Halomonas sp. DP8Y7-1 TaxID=2859078 RepID=UPI001C96971C|nr:lipid II flippase MurJ [Halomonas sp. DP8Y7-1]MBY6030856.1 oligosaccharide flippase family protein [Halomonas sp. DP8Y7-1]
MKNALQSLGFKGFIRNVGATFVRQVGSGLIQLATVALIAKAFGAQGNGIYSVALLLPLTLASLLNLGLSPANVYYLGAGKVSALTAWRKTMSAYMVIVTIGLLFGSSLILIFRDTLFPGVQPFILWIALTIFPFLLLLNFVSSFFQGMQQFKSFNIILLLQPLITLSGVCTVLLLDVKSVGALLISYLIGVASTLLVSLVLVRKLLTGGQDELESYLKSSMLYGLKAHLSNVITFINYKSDVFLVNFIVGPVGAGVYVVAVQFAERLWILSTAVSTVLLPRLSELSREEDKMHYVTPLVCRWVIMLTLFGSILLLAIVTPIIDIVFTDEFDNVVNILIFLLPGIVLWSGGRVLSNDIAARGKPELNLYVSIIVLVTNILLNILLIPQFGLIGAATATSIAYVLDFLIKLKIYSVLVRCGMLEPVVVKFEDIRNIAKIVNLK